MRKVQNANASRALERQFGLTGRITLNFDEVGVPTQDVGDFAGRSPYQQDARWLGSDTLTSPAAGVGTYAGVLITPAPGTVLVVERLWGCAGGNEWHQVRLMRPVDVAAVTVSAATQAIARTNGRIRSTGFIDQIAGTYSLFNHTAIIGGLVGFFNVSANRLTEFPIGRGVYLDGNDPLGPISLATWQQSANLAMIHGFQLAEYQVAP